MDKESLLLKQMVEEFNRFMDTLDGASKDIIVDMAYEIVVKSDILCLVENGDFEEQEIDVLLNMQAPLESIYITGFDKGITLMEELRDTINDVITERTVQLNTKNNYELDDSSIEMIEDNNQKLHGEDEEDELEP